MPFDPTGRAGADALARLVGSDRDGFEAAWGRRPWLHHGAPTADLLDEAGIDELLSSRGLRTPFLRVAKDGATVPERAFTAGGGVGAAVADQLDDARLARLFADGSTLVLQGLHRTWAPIGELVGDLADELGHPVQANVYVTPPQSRGFSAHYDVHDVFVLQLSGEKRWVIHEPVLTWPMRDEPWEAGGRRDLVAEAAQSEPVLDVVLRPGDCLYLPRGYLHAATALGGVSAHLTLGVHVWTRQHLATELIRQALAAVDLREPLRLGVDVGDPTELAQEAAEVRAVLVAAISDLSDADLAATMDLRADETARPEPLSPLAQAAAARDLGCVTTVRLRRHLRLRRTHHGADVRLRGRGIDVTVPEDPELTGSLAEILDRLLDGRAHPVPGGPVGAGSVLHDGESTAASSEHAVIRRLLAAGVLVPADRRSDDLDEAHSSAEH